MPQRGIVDMNFINNDKALLTVMVQADNPDRIKELIDKSLADGAEAFGMQFCRLKNAYRRPDVYKDLFSYTDKPVYVTNYRLGENEGKTDSELGYELIELAECGASLCDVPADLFDPCTHQFTENADAIQKQIDLIKKIHEKGALVLMSAHTGEFIDGALVLEMARAFKERGADICKIVTDSPKYEDQLENLKTLHKLKQELDSPFLFLTGGECSIIRNLGGELGCCMYLCVEEYDDFSTPVQPLLKNVKMIRDGMSAYRD